MIWWNISTFDKLDKYMRVFDIGVIWNEESTTLSDDKDYMLLCVTGSVFSSHCMAALYNILVYATLSQVKQTVWIE